MKPIIPAEKIERIKELLKEYKKVPPRYNSKLGKHSLREIADIVGVSFYTVYRVYNEKGAYRKKVERIGYFNVYEVDWLTGWKPLYKNEMVG